jgi:hypothetical protein
MKVQTETCCRVLGEYEVELLRSMVVRLRTEVSVDMAPSDERHVVVLKPAGALVDDMGSQDVERGIEGRGRRPIHLIWFVGIHNGRSCLQI